MRWKYFCSSLNYGYLSIEDFSADYKQNLKVIVKDFLAILIGISASLLINAQDINTTNILTNYNSIRNELTGSDVILYEDTLISDILSNKTYLDYLQKEFSKDSLRAILRDNGVYDYQIEFIKLIYDKEKLFDNEYIKEDHDEFINALKDTSYNRIGIYIKTGKDILNVYCIVTKRFIELNPIMHGNVKFGYGDSKFAEHIIQLFGRSYINNFQYVSVEGVDQFSEKQNKHQVEIQNDNMFEISIDITPGSVGAKDKYIIITDDKNNILSIIQFQKL